MGVFQDYCFISVSIHKDTSAKVLFNLLNELRILFFFFRNKFNKFSNTRALMLDSIYHKTSNLIKNRIFGVKTFKIFTQLYNDVI